jgi:PAS domain S-box-containing protein
LRAFPAGPGRIAALCGIGLLYLAFAEVGLAFPTDQNKIIALLWLPIGVAIVACGWSHWAVLPVALAVLIVELRLGLGWGPSLALMVSNTLAPWLAAQWLKRLGVTEHGGGLDDLRRYLFACAGAALLTSTNGIFWLWLSGNVAPHHLPLEYLRWFLGDALGAMLIVTMAWPALNRKRVIKWDRMQRASWVDAAVFAFPLIIGALMWTLPGDLTKELSAPLFILLLIPLVFSVAQWGSALTHVFLLLIGSMVTAITALGRGPFYRPGFEGSDWLLWSFIASALCLTSITVALRHHLTSNALALAASEQRFRTLVDTATAGVVLTEDGFFTYVNAAFAKMLGRPVNEIIGKHYLELTDPRDHERNIKFREDCLRAGKGQARMEFEKRYLRSDQTPVWARVSASQIRTEKTGPVTVVGVVVDQTSNKLAEQALIDKTEQLELVLSASRSGVWDYQLVPRIAFFSRELKAMIGLPEAYALQFHEVFARIHRDDFPVLDVARRAQIKQGERLDVEFRIRHSDGHFIWVRCVGDAQIGEDRRVLRTYGTVVDITQAKLVQQEREGREKAEQASKAKSEVLSRLSHELRTPLNAVLGFSQLLQISQAETLSPQQRLWVDHVRSSGHHLLGLIDDLLDLSQVEQGGLNVHLASVDVAVVVARAIAMVEVMASQHQVSIRAPALAVGQCWVRADEMKLTQVLTNLLSNAIKYNRAQGQVSFGVFEQGKQLQLSVVDTGRGFTAEQANRMFQPFERLGMEETTVQGTGIGLALVKRLVEAMDGTIQAKGFVGKGAIFTICLPRIEVAVLDENPIRSTSPATSQ